MSRLRDGWYPTRTFQGMFGSDEGTTGIDDGFAARGFDNIGAWIMGRNMFGPLRGAWSDESWKGWSGENPSYHVPVFVLTHHARPSLQMEGGTVFHFVSDPIETVLVRAKAATDGRDVRLGGGVATIRQYLQARLIDELRVAVAPRPARWRRTPLCRPRCARARLHGHRARPIRAGHTHRLVKAGVHERCCIEWRATAESVVMRASSRVQSPGSPLVLARFPWGSTGPAARPPPARRSRSCTTGSNTEDWAALSPRGLVSKRQAGPVREGESAGDSPVANQLEQSRRRHT